MRKITLLLFMLSVSCNLYVAGQQTRVQGVPYDMEGAHQKPVLKEGKSTKSDFTFDDIQFWAGEGENRAALIVDFHLDDDDGKTGMVWGFRWPEGTTANGLDMIATIAKADPRFLLLTQETNLGYTIDAIGFGPLRANFNIEYDLEGASTDSSISFKFDNPNVMMKQTHCPENPMEEIEAAIEDGIGTGVIYHPFNYTNYGYACYDYDHWSCTNEDVEWQSGWYNGYWSYLIKDDIDDDFSYSGVGAILRELQDGSVDSWGYQDFSNPSHSGVEPREPYIAVQPMILINEAQASSEKVINIDSEVQLSYSVHPVSATIQKASWSSDNESVATVNADGLVKAQKSGTAIITAAIDGEDIQPFSYVIRIEEANVGIKEVGDNKDVMVINSGTLIFSNYEGYSFTIYNLSGQAIKSFVITNADYSCAINQQGVFILKGTNGSSSVIKKIAF